MRGVDKEKKTDGGEGGMISREGGTVLDLQALPEGCIAKIISLTTPQDACKLSSVSRSFCSAAQSDVVWDNFLPPDIHTILSSSSLSYSPNSNSKSKKDLYLALCDNPVLIHEGKMSFSVDKWSGKKCYTISARGLMIVWGDTPRYWTWISRPDSRFKEVAELLQVWWLEIRGKIDTRLLSPSTVYKAYLVFKFSAIAYGFDDQTVELTVGVAGSQSTTKSVFLTGQRENGGPKERADGWLEVELGDFFCPREEDHHGDLEMAVVEIHGGLCKRGLIVYGIEVRPKRN